ncbi:MAG: hypothetical protein SFW64_01130 [Alphaproteobacteria bacterium]|nr:hypothetical protein [Alphaproteobacteria bacterium]
MKHSAALLCLCLALTACATVTTENAQTITVSTTPEGMRCTLANDSGNWSIEHTPGSVEVARSFSPLQVECTQADGTKLTRQIGARTRGRAYGNILLLGIPALVDAGTGTGYEYSPEELSLTLEPSTKP